MVEIVLGLQQNGKNSPRTTTYQPSYSIGATKTESIHTLLNTSKNSIDGFFVCEA